MYVVVDRFNKMCISMPCKKKITSEQTIQLFFQNEWVHFGFHISIVNDRDSRFVMKFWSILWGFMDTKLKKSTTFHPQSDYQIEVVNRTMIHLLRGYCSKHPKCGMNICTIFSMLTTGQSTIQLKHHHLNHVWDTCLSLLWISCLEKMFLLMVIVT